MAGNAVAVGQGAVAGLRRCVGRPAEATRALGNQVAEGVFTTEAALGMARRMGLELPITEEVGRLLQGADPSESVKRLMQRSLKQA